jgi:hypothetical protein
MLDRRGPKAHILSSMTDHGDPPAAIVDAHDRDEELAPDEPRTPMWLPLVGGLVFLGGIFLFAATRPPPKTADELSREAAAAAAERVAEEQAAAQAAAPPEPAAPAPAPEGAPGGQAPKRGG